jgi:hypothetical protein
MKQLKIIRVNCCHKNTVLVANDKPPAFAYETPKPVTIMISNIFIACCFGCTQDNFLYSEFNWLRAYICRICCGDFLNG